MIDSDIRELIELIRKASYEVRSHLQGRFIESVYRNALVIELRNLGLNVEVEKSVKAFYKNQVVGDFRLDLLVNDCIVIELKSVAETVVAHDIQLVNYLQATGYDYGILINFGGNSLFFRVKTRNYPPK